MTYSWRTKPTHKDGHLRFVHTYIIKELDKSLLLVNNGCNCDDNRQDKSCKSPYWVFGKPVEHPRYSAPVHVPPSRVCLKATVMSTPSNVGHHIDFPQSGSVEGYELHIFECLCFFCASQKIASANVVLFK